jgi:hypothetical protein
MEWSSLIARQMRWQVVICIALCPFVIALQGYNPMTELTTYISNGYSCWLYGHTSTTPVVCHDGPIAVTLYLTISLSFNALLMIIWQTVGSPALVLAANCIGVPLSVFVFDWHTIMGQHTTHITSCHNPSERYDIYTRWINGNDIIIIWCTCITQ